MEVVDPENGVVSESMLLVEKIYRFYDTHAGVKISDSYIQIAVDSLGVTGLRDNRKHLDPESAFSESESPIDREEAKQILLDRHPRSDCAEQYALSLAYVPDGAGGYVLCYEFACDCGFYYVDSSTGENVQY